MLWFTDLRVKTDYDKLTIKITELKLKLKLKLFIKN